MCGLSDAGLVWLSVWSKVHTCIWPSWCHCHRLSLTASVKSRLIATHPVPDEQPLNESCCLFVDGFICVVAATDVAVLQSIIRNVDAATPKKKSRASCTPKKLLTPKSSRLRMQSPGGPYAVRTTNFVHVASLQLTKANLMKTSFSLEKVRSAILWQILTACYVYMWIENLWLQVLKFVHFTKFLKFVNIVLLSIKVLESLQHCINYKYRLRGTWLHVLVVHAFFAR